MSREGPEGFRLTGPEDKDTGSIRRLATRHVAAERWLHRFCIVYQRRWVFWAPPRGYLAPLSGTGGRAWLRSRRPARRVTRSSSPAVKQLAQPELADPNVANTSAKGSITIARNAAIHQWQGLAWGTDKEAQWSERRRGGGSMPPANLAASR